MATLFIEEYANAGDSKDGKQINVTGDVLANQKITIEATTAASSAFSANTEYLVIHADAACYYKVDDGTATATTSTSHLPANTLRAVECKPSQTIAVIQE